MSMSQRADSSHVASFDAGDNQNETSSSTTLAPKSRLIARDASRKWRPGNSSDNHLSLENSSLEPMVSFPVVDSDVQLPLVRESSQE
jgi:hypothetical protein